MYFISALIAAVTLLSACSSNQKAAETQQAPTLTLPTTLEEAVASGYRTEANKERDKYRNPVATLTFFGIKPEMTVVEISPGSGWYTEILAPYLSRSGNYIAAAAPAGDNAYLQEMNAKVDAWVKSHPDVKVTKANFAPPEPIVPDGTADLILTFRNVHNWMARDTAQAAFNSFFKALKPGGTLGVTEHRANPKAKLDPKAANGYVPEKEVIRMATKAGLKLAAKSEINANPKDTKDHPEGVWTLPPTLRLKEKDREKYLAIGESDRMTLKFVKPARK